MVQTAAWQKPSYKALPPSWTRWFVSVWVRAFNFSIVPLTCNTAGVWCGRQSVQIFTIWFSRQTLNMLHSNTVKLLIVKSCFFIFRKRLCYRNWCNTCCVWVFDVFGFFKINSKWRKHALRKSSAYGPHIIKGKGMRRVVIATGCEEDAATLESGLNRWYMWYIQID